MENFKREKKKTETAQAELSNLNVELRSDNKSLQEELERTKRDLENLRKKQSRAETRERELNGRVERRNSTIQQLRRELKEAQSVQPREEGEITSAAILESGKKKKAEWSDCGKDQSRGENPRDPRRKGRLEEFSLQTNESFFQSELPWEKSEENCFDQRQSRRETYSESTPFYHQKQYFNYQFHHYQSLYSGNINMQYNQNSTV